MARFDKRARLRKAGDFTTVLGRGTRLPGQLLDAVVTAGAAERPRLGLAIASRNVPLAVRRNRIKRLVRESFRRSAGALPAVDVVITARRGAASSPDGAVREELQHLWERIAARCRTS